MTHSYITKSLLLGMLAVSLSQNAVSAETNSANSAISKNSAFMISEAQFEKLFPKRIPFYTYAGLVGATTAYPEFGNSGTEEQKKQEVAAFLANVMHESHHLTAITEVDQSAHDKYCNDKEGTPCAKGKQYFGRGPIQLSWNFNYALAGQSLHLDLLNDPDMVSRDPVVAWKTALWYWMTMNGPAPIPAHASMQQGLGFGETVRSINGILECSKPASNIGYKQQQMRIKNYLHITKLLGVKPGKHTPC